MLDSLRNFTDIDNDSKTMILMNALMNIREAGGSVLCLHHSNKDGRNFKGSNHIHNSADCCFSLLKLEGGLNLQITPTKERVGLQKLSLSIHPQTLEIQEVDEKIVQMNERERSFTKAVREILERENLPQSVILATLGFERDHQWARKTLDAFSGIFWEVSVVGKNKIFSLIHHNHHNHHKPQNREDDSGEGVGE